MYKTLTHNVVREVTPLTSSDCFTISSRIINGFECPLHYHEEYELTLILNAKGAKRVVGNSIDVINSAELVFIGPNLYHSWFTHQCNSGSIHEVSVKFHKDLFNEAFLQRNQLCLLKNMFNNAQRGILFSKETVVNTVERLINLQKKMSCYHLMEAKPLL